MPTRPYYKSHKRVIDRIIKDYSNSFFQRDLFFESADMSIFNALETGITRHQLRYYQLEALYVLDSIYAQSQAEKFQSKRPGYKENTMITDLMEIIDREANYYTPFIGYEMATGSGKTMLMGASIYLLNKRYGIKNFLIIAPSSLDIYQKTIRNFTIGGIDSIWADETTFTFNLVTGDNYTEKLFIDYNKDANIFIFNIDKFGANAVNTDKPWESSQWQDEQGNAISIRDYLRRQKLVIITDEAHHTQGRKSMTIIKKFHPEAVLEYTATANESTRSEEKRQQQIVYKYDIRRFLEDGHGKLVRAVALDVEDKKSKKEREVTDSERLKLITLLLIHLVKKQAVLKDPKARAVKPVSFVKVKNDTPYTQKIFDYIQNELADDIDNIQVIINKAASQDIEITNLITDLIKDIYNEDHEKLKFDIKDVCKRSIFYHGESDQITKKQFLEIRKNDIELVVYMIKLDEGIDLPNIYTMAVINDTVSSFKTSVKQIIGRGVRLSKEKREFDEEKYDLLKAQSERLHVVCDQGKNFEEVIVAIQNEFGLTDKYLSIDKPRQDVINKLKSDRLEQRYIPRVRADFKVRDGVNLMKLVRDENTIIDQYLENNCFADPKGIEKVKRYLKYRPESFFVEVDIFADSKIYHEQMRDVGADFYTMKLQEKQTRAIYGIVQRNLFCLPDTRRVYDVFEEYTDRLNDIGLQYPKLDDADDLLALNHLIHNFSFFYRNHIEKNFYKLDFQPIRTDDRWNLRSQFQEYQLKIPEDQIKNDTLQKIEDPEKLKELIKSQYYFYGYENAIFDYVKFDAYTEKQFADFAETILKNANPDEKPFWVRNERQIYFNYGSHKYYPDFIMFYNKMFYVIETKGEIFSDTRKNLLLAELSHYSGYEGVLVFSDVMNQVEREIPSFEDFLSLAEESVKRYQSKANLKKSPDETEKYIKYIPALQPQKAYKKYIKEQKINIDGWLEVPAQTNGYPESCFAVQVKGDLLLPEYKHNSWVILTKKFNNKNCIGNLVLIQHNEINDGYKNNVTIRRLRIEQVPSDGLFDANKVILEAINNQYEPISFSSGVENIVGVLYKPEKRMNVIYNDNEIDESTKYKTYLPVYSLKAAATSFGKEEYVECEGWMKATIGKKLNNNMFICQVVGQSMEPTIPDGSYCVFQLEKGGSRNGKVVLVESRQVTDPETNQKFTVKRYQSEKEYHDDDTWEHKKIILSPDNKKFDNIILENVSEDDFSIVAEFVKKLC